MNRPTRRMIAYIRRAMVARIILCILPFLSLETILLADNGIIVQHTAPKEPLPVDGSSFPPKDQPSTISVPVRISLADLTNQLNTTVPMQFNGTQSVSVPGADRGSNVTYTVHRSAFALSPY